MLSNGLDQVKWHFYRQAEKFGMLGVLAIFLMLVALLGYVCFVLPAKGALLDMQSTPLADVSNQKAGEVSDLEAQISAFTGLLPMQDEKTNQIEHIIGIAKAQALQLSAVQYQAKESETILKTDMKFSVQSDYPSLKAFLNEVSYQLPNVALQAMHLQRDNSDKQSVKSTIQLTLYYRQTP